MIRSPMCNGNPETTVLAHVRQIGVSGIGLKSPDICGAWACSNCHAYCDQVTTAGKESRDLLILKGMVRTINELIKKDLIRW
jgi:hypothetical protein